MDKLAGDPVAVLFTHSSLARVTIGQEPAFAYRVRTAVTSALTGAPGEAAQVASRRRPHATGHHVAVHIGTYVTVGRARVLFLCSLVSALSHYSAWGSHRKSLSFIGTHAQSGFIQ
jgi:hypothetical protein